ncbi:MAG TPA: hypothetical protein VHO48_15415, partial [Anaerolineaceae bacterium]|nr:hypothetical protein [Anaerolineaceae bacterium]
MSSLRESIKSSLPQPVVAAVRETRDAAVRARDWIPATFHPWRRDSMRRLAELKDTHRCERCFIIGNGPSLRNTDLSRLKGEYSIG